LAWTLNSAAFSQGAVRPKDGSSCYSSLVALGTGRTAPDDRFSTATSTSVVNIWAFVDQSRLAAAWIVKNAAGTYRFQANVQRIPILKEALERRLFSHYVYLQYGPTSPANLVVLNLNDERTIVNELRRRNVVLTACFLTDLPDSDL
jgi:hypothetical protein